MVYSDKVEDHFENPRNMGSFGPIKEVHLKKELGLGMAGSPECGDLMKLEIKVERKEDGIEYITDAKFKMFGCGSAIASASLATELIKGKTLDDALLVNNKQILEELSLPPIKIHCSVLAEDAIKAAVQNYRLKNS